MCVSFCACSWTGRQDDGLRDERLEAGGMNRRRTDRKGWTACKSKGELRVTQDIKEMKSMANGLRKNNAA